MKRKFLKKYHGRGRVHDQVKDRLFRFLFEKNREALLELYNALNGTDYEDAIIPICRYGFSHIWHRNTK